MEWGIVEPQELRRFLFNFTNPDPSVQASQVEQLRNLAAYPSALLATLAVVTDGASPLAVRLAATTVARHLLLQHGDRVTVYLRSAGCDDEVVLLTAMGKLLNCTLDVEEWPRHTSASLQRSTGSLVALLVTALARVNLPAATVMWSHLVMGLLHHSSSVSSISNSDTSSSGACPIAPQGPSSALLLRELCESPLVAAPALREWVGGEVEQSLSLCSLLSAQLRLLQHHIKMEREGAKGAPLSPSAPWMENILAAFLSCVESGALPGVSSMFADAVSDSGEAEGPAAQSLRTVSAAVGAIQRTIQSVILEDILRPLCVLTTESPVVGVVHLRSSLQFTAPLVAVGMRYMANAVLLEAFEPLQPAFANAAVPLLGHLCRVGRLTELQYDGAGEPDSVHAALVACVDYVAEWLSVGSPIGTPDISSSPDSNAVLRSEEAPSASAATALYTLLVDAATLPLTVVGRQLVEHTTHCPDSAAQLLVRSAAGRRRGRQNLGDGSEGLRSCNATVQSGFSMATNLKNNEYDDDKSGGKNGREEREAEDFGLADAVDAVLPDDGTLRQAATRAAAALSCWQEWWRELAMLVARGSTSPLGTADDAAAYAGEESTLLISNELLDSLLTDEKSIATLAKIGPLTLEHDLATRVQHILLYLSPSDAGGRAPFFLRRQVVRFLGRWSAGLMGTWLFAFKGTEGNRRYSYTAQRTYTLMALVGGLEELLSIILRVFASEVNKAVQAECVAVLTFILTSYLKTVHALNSGEHKDDTESDLEEESLGSSTSSSEEDVVGDEDARPRPIPSDGVARVYAFCQAFGVAPDHHLLVQTVQDLSERLNSVQWSVRQPLYHLFSEVLPALWCFASPGVSPSSVPLGRTPPLDLGTVRMVTTQVLETLAQHYATLLRYSSDPSRETATTAAALADSPSLLEQASVLTCMASLASAMDGGALEMVVPWILRVVHHMLDRYAQYLTGRTDSTHDSSPSCSSLTVDMTDMCMVSLDLVSCVCDGVLSRDALLELQLRGIRKVSQRPELSEDGITVDRRMRSFAKAILHPLASGDHAAAALPTRCIALLSLCQSSLDHPSRSPAATDRALEGGCAREEEEAEALRVDDEFGEVRRACFSVVYDSVFLVAYPISLFHPIPPQAFCGDTTTSSMEEGLSAALVRDVLCLCLREILLSPASEGRCEEQLQWCAAHNVAASDAWLSLGSVLSLWDQQMHSRLPGTHPSTQPHSPATTSVLCGNDGHLDVPFYVQCGNTLNSLLALLHKRSSAFSLNRKLNMTSAACGLALLLCNFTTPPDPIKGSSCCGGLPLTTLSALLSVTTCARFQSYAPDAAKGDRCGIYEVFQVLWCVGRVWQVSIVSASPAILQALVNSHGKEMAKLIAWWTRWATIPKATTRNRTPSAPADRPAWGALVAVWRSLGHTLQQAAQEGILSLSPSQLSGLHHLEWL